MGAKRKDGSDTIFADMKKLFADMKKLFADWRARTPDAEARSDKTMKNERKAKKAAK